MSEISTAGQLANYRTRYALFTPETSPTRSPRFNSPENENDRSWRLSAHRNNTITRQLLTPPPEDSFASLISTVASSVINDVPRPLNTSSVAEELATNTPGSRPNSPKLRSNGSFNRRKRLNIRSPLSSPDRFIPSRRSPSASTKSFHLSTPPEELSSGERLVRNRGTDADPFLDPHQSASDRERAFTLQLPPRRIDAIAFGTTHRQSHGLAFRQTRIGNVWNFEEPLAANQAPAAAVPNGRGGMLSSGTTAPMYRSRFLTSSDHDQQMHEGRLALAFDFDSAEKVLHFQDATKPPDLWSHFWKGHQTVTRQQNVPPINQTIWRDGAWKREGSVMFLDAPLLRDDFYCSLIAYCHTTHSLAVGLDRRVYMWSESHKVRPMIAANPEQQYVTALAFSSTDGENAILGIARADGHLALWSLFEQEPRFEAQQPVLIGCLAWKPHATTRRTQKNESGLGPLVKTEDLLAGDDIGNVYYYVVEWPNEADRSDSNWHGAMTLVARISAHSQQICGLAWSLDGLYFATGGNDNSCCLFEVASTICWPRTSKSAPQDVEEIVTDDNGVQRHVVVPGRGRSLAVPAGRQKHRWLHGAAVKAIAFCPWLKGLIATGGGSNDRCIHFYHVSSGASLAKITVAAQVTSLIWSKTRREIAATFGYAQPDHPYRIAVFSWPDCRQVVSIPWATESRALYATSYPVGPSDSDRNERTVEGDSWTPRTAEEGCIVVVSSDQSIKFHEVWSEGQSVSGSRLGPLGGSDILESLEGIDNEGPEIIR